MTKPRFASPVRLAVLALFAVGALALPLLASAGKVCIQVITYAEDPKTGECIAFPTPCDVPKGWKSCGPGPVAMTSADPTESAEQKSEACIQVITFARNPETGACTAFPTPCDVPDGWESCNGFPWPTEDS